MPFHIRISQKIAPFSHTTWFRSVIPHTTCLAEIFPTALHIQEWEGEIYKNLFQLTGPVKGFTVQIDAQKGALRVFGTAQEGAFSYLLFAEKEGIYLFLEKGPLPFPVKMKHRLVEIKEFQSETSEERLSLGMHKKQEWDQVIRRCDLREIFPTWLALGWQLPLEKGEKSPNKEGNYDLLSACRQVVLEKKKGEVIDAFTHLFQAGFSGVLVPHLNDPRFLGLSTPTEKHLSPLPLFKESAELIRSLFFQEEGDLFSILPIVPPEFHSGRFVNLLTARGDRIDLEWTKKLVRRVIIHPKETREVRLLLQKPLKSFRVRVDRSDRGKRVLATDPLTLKRGCPLYLDRFEK